MEVQEYCLGDQLVDEWACHHSVLFMKIHDWEKTTVTSKPVFNRCPSTLHRRISFFLLLRSGDAFVLPSHISSLLVSWVSVADRWSFNIPVDEKVLELRFEF